MRLRLSDLSDYPDDRNSSLLEFSNKGDNVKSFFEYYFYDLLIRHFGSFKGETGRKQFLIGLLIANIFLLPSATIDLIFGKEQFTVTTISSLFLSAAFIPVIARRLKVAGVSKWLCLVFVLILLVEGFCSFKNVDYPWSFEKLRSFAYLWLILLPQKKKVFKQRVKFNLVDAAVIFIYALVCIVGLLVAAELGVD